MFDVSLNILCVMKSIAEFVHVIWQARVEVVWKCLQPYIDVSQEAGGRGKDLILHGKVKPSDNSGRDRKNVSC